MKIAIESATASRPEISSAQVTPSNITAQQLTLEEAEKRIHQGNEIVAGYDPKMQVWLVTMDGLWWGEMSAPGVVPTPEPVPYHHSVVILDAKTGDEIENSLSQ